MQRQRVSRENGALMTRVAEPIISTANLDDEATPRPQRGWIALLSVGFLAQVVWRVLISWPVSAPIAHVDEDGYLFGARVLSGGPDTTLPSWSIMRPIGYPLTLVPAYLFADRIETAYQIVHVINALLLSLTFPLIYLFARRMFGLERRWAAGIAFVLAALPSMVFFGQFALTDALLPVLVMTILYCVHQVFATTGRRVMWYAAGAGAVAAYAANTHVRGLVMLVILGAVVALGGWRRWISWRVLPAVAAPAIVVYFLGVLANGWLERRLFTAGAYTPDTRIVDRLTSLKGIALVLCNAAGQIWHLGTSTWGLGAIGLAAAGWAIYKRQGARPTRIVLGMAMAITASIALATAAGTPIEGRVNNHMYGRYVAMFAAFWVLVGVVALIRSTRREARWLAAGGSGIVLLSIAAVLAYAGRRMTHEGFVNFDAPELAFLTNDYKWGRNGVNMIRLLQVSGYSVILMFAFAYLIRGWRRSTVVTLAATLVVNLVAMVAITVNISAAWVDEQYNQVIQQLQRDAGIQPGDTVVEDPTIGWFVNVRHQHEVYWSALPAFDPFGPEPTAKYVIARSVDPRYPKRIDVYIWDGTQHGYSPVITGHEGGNGNWTVWRRNGT